MPTSTTITPRATAIVGAVVITFNPDPARLARVIAALAGQARMIAVIDNNSRDDPAPVLAAAAVGTLIDLIRLDDNYGIAAAQNIGLAWARERGCTHVLTLDHDAVAAAGMVGRLLDEMQTRQARGERVAAVGPLINDPRRAAPAPFFRLRRWRIERVTTADPGEASARVDFLIAAGMLTSILNGRCARAARVIRYSAISARPSTIAWVKSR
jgi:rhamnosyltransferase